MINKRPSYLDFDRAKYFWKSNINYRQYPTKYRVGKGEQGVLICEPYKTEILPYWKFKTPLLAKKSSQKIYKMFVEYLAANDFVGADIARKFLQMGFTRARRYANYKGGKKYDKENSYAINEKGTGEQLKAESAAIFFKYWKKAESNMLYNQLKKEWRKQYG